MNRALLLVDVQNDFFPKGALPTLGGNKIITPINRLIRLFLAGGEPIFATRDWHPRNHCSFRDFGGIWPPHCIQGTPGAKFKSEIELPPSVTVVSKGQNADKDAYSGFDGTELSALLSNANISQLIVAGLATEVCVFHTVIDALEEGLEVHVVLDAVRSIGDDQANEEEALQEMEEAGAEIDELQDIVEMFSNRPLRSKAAISMGDTRYV